MDYYAIVTNQGKTKIARALQNGTALNITKFCVGDGGGSAVTPSASQTKLVNQKWIGNVTSYTSANDTISATTVVPANVGSFTVREMGIIDSDGDLFAVANVPDTVKNNSSSILSTLNLTISVKVDNADTVKFTVVESNNDYCICKTAANIADKVAECENFALTKGKRVVVEFTNVNTADSVTLNINNTGAKALRSGGSALKANMLLANQPYELIYDGTAYEIVGAVVTTQIAPISLGKETISLNTITEIGDYFAGSGNNVTDYPTGATKGGGLTLRVCQSGDSSRLQIFLNQNGMWLRSSRDVSAKTWNGWIKVYSSANAVKINGTVFDGTADITVPATPTFTALVSKDLNTVTAQGFYGGGANNSCTNLPTEVSTFMLIVSRNTSGTGYTQVLVDTATRKMYVRNFYNQKWQAWIGVSIDGHTHNINEINNLYSALNGIHKTYYIASSTSDSKYKDIADIVIDSTEDIATVLNNILTKTESNNTDKYVINSDYDKVYIFAGNYTLQTTLKLSKSNVTIEGCKDSIVKVIGDGKIFIGLTQSNNNNSLTMNVKIKGFTLDSNGSNAIISIGSNAGTSCQNITIEDMFIIRRKDIVGIEAGTSRNLTIKDNVFYRLYNSSYNSADVYVITNVFLLQGNISSNTYPINFGSYTQSVTMAYYNGNLISEMCKDLTLINQAYVDMNSKTV